jgi:hypothetical protein
LNTVCLLPIAAPTAYGSLARNPDLASPAVMGALRMQFKGAFVKAWGCPIAHSFGDSAPSVFISKQ